MEPNLKTPPKKTVSAAIVEIEKLFSYGDLFGKRKAIRLLETAMVDAMNTVGTTNDCTDLIQLLTFIKQNDKIHPTEYQSKPAVGLIDKNQPKLPDEPPKYIAFFSMNIKFHTSHMRPKEAIAVRIMLEYHFPHRIQYIAYATPGLHNDIEKDFKLIAGKIEQQYLAIPFSQNTSNN